jgi:hypothetical protein
MGQEHSKSSPSLRGTVEGGRVSGAVEKGTVQSSSDESRPSSKKRKFSDTGLVHAPMGPCQPTCSGTTTLCKKLKAEPPSVDVLGGRSSEDCNVKGDALRRRQKLTEKQRPEPTEQHWERNLRQQSSRVRLSSLMELERVMQARSGGGNELEVGQVEERVGWMTRRPKGIGEAAPKRGDRLRICGRDHGRKGAVGGRVGANIGPRGRMMRTAARPPFTKFHKAPSSTQIKTRKDDPSQGRCAVMDGMADHDVNGTAIVLNKTESAEDALWNEPRGLSAEVREGKGLEGLLKEAEEKQREYEGKLARAEAREERLLGEMRALKRTARLEALNFVREFYQCGVRDGAKIGRMGDGEYNVPAPF